MMSFLKGIYRTVALFFIRLTRKFNYDVVTDINRETKHQANDILAAINAGVSESVQFVPYVPGEKVRILFLFQAASFWPSWESFYYSCIQDPRFDVKLVLLDEIKQDGEITQMLSAAEFLKSRGIPYYRFSEKLLSEFAPHVFVMQTPYDGGHRLPHTRSSTIRNYGARIVYVTYGIEIVETADAMRAHFEEEVIRNSWRIYTFSHRMRADYAMHSPNGIAVRCYGHPKFDGLFHKETFPLPQDVLAKAHGRKICLWHVHFPKLVPQEDFTRKMATPALEEYVAFAKYLRTRKDVFFIFQPHPKFLDCKEPLNHKAKEIVQILESLENVYIDKNDDYRPCLVNANFIITDRSAIMVESGAIGVPVIYMHNKDYAEPLTAAVQPLVNSYYHGTKCDDMISFVEQCLKDEDPQKKVREEAFHECVPYFDGKCGERIKEDIYNGVCGNMNYIRMQLHDMQARIANLENRSFNA